MDPKTWMRQAVAAGAFKDVDDITPAELGKAARVALRLPREQWARCRQWAAEVLAEPRPPRPEPPPPRPCADCGAPIAWNEEAHAAYHWAEPGRFRIADVALGDPAARTLYRPRYLCARCFATLPEWMQEGNRRVDEQVTEALRLIIRSARRWAEAEASAQRLAED